LKAINEQYRALAEVVQSKKTIKSSEGAQVRNQSEIRGLKYSIVEIRGGGKSWGSDKVQRGAT